MHIDTFTIVRGVVVVVGWSEGAIPEIFYDGAPITAIYSRFRRDDLCGMFGDKAADWGFRGAAIPKNFDIDASKLSVRLSDGRLATPLEFASHTAVQRQLVLSKFLAKMVKNSGSILEIGSRSRSGNSYKQLFPKECEYKGIDITAGPNVDIVGDAHHLTRFVDQKFDYVFSVSVFEHILMPWQVATEMNAIMNDGGYAYIQSHHGWPLHEEPWDFWRFSVNAWNGLFNKHTGFEVIASGYDISAMIVPDINFGGPLQNIDTHHTHLLSACLVQKIGPAFVNWGVEASEIYDMQYSHA